MPWPTKQKKDDGDKLYLELDKVHKIRLIDDEPSLYYTHYVNGKTIKCEQTDCEHCEAGVKQNTKGTMLVLDMADGKQKALSGTAALFIAIKETLDMCEGGKGKFVFSMKATGEKTERRYHIVPLPFKADESGIPF